MTSRIGRPPHPDVLTPAEWRVLEQVRAGHPNAEIAVRLGISVNTVKYHVANMLAKLEVPDRAALAEWDGQPKRRFGFLPTLPPIGPLALGLSLGRGAAVLGGLAAAMVVVVAIALSNSAAPEARTDVLLRMGGFPYQGRLVPLDPLTGAPLEDAGSLDLIERIGGPATRDGSLLWYIPVRDDLAPEDGTLLTVVSGAPLRLRPPAYLGDENGVIQQWTLPATDEFASIALAPLSASGGDVGYGLRTMLIGDRPDELWALNLRTGSADRLMTAPGIAGLAETSDGRLFVAVHSRKFDLTSARTEVLAVRMTAYLSDSDDYLLELDRRSGAELGRIDIGGRIASVLLSPDQRSVILLGAGNGAITEVDLSTMTAERRLLPPGGPQPGLPLVGPTVSAAVSPDGQRLYLSGTDHSSCILGGELPCGSQSLGFRVIDLERMELRYADASPSSFAMSANGRWLITARQTPSFDAGDDVPAGLKVIDARTLEVVAHLEPESTFESVVITHDGRYAYATSDGPGLGQPPDIRNCTSSCGTVTVIDLDALEVIATHTYDEPLQWLTALE